MAEYHGQMIHLLKNSCAQLKSETLLAFYRTRRRKSIPWRPLQMHLFSSEGTTHMRVFWFRPRRGGSRESKLENNENYAIRGLRARRMFVWFKNRREGVAYVFCYLRFPNLTNDVEGKSDGFI